MQIVSNGHNLLHEFSKPVFWEKKISNFMSAEFAHRMMKLSIWNTRSGLENISAPHTLYLSFLFISPDYT